MAPAFTPHNIGLLLAHFTAAADGLVRSLAGATTADLSTVFQATALEAALRAMFSMPDNAPRERLAGLVRPFVAGPGRPGIIDGFAPTETSFGFLLRKRRAFQKVWFAAIDEVVGARKRTAHDAAHRDLLDILLAAHDPETGDPLASDEIRDQCATMIFGGFETMARLLFWTAYLLTLDLTEQERLREEVVAFPPERVAALDDDRRPVMPVGRLTIEPSRAPLFRLARV